MAPPLRAQRFIALLATIAVALLGGTPATASYRREPDPVPIPVPVPSATSAPPSPSPPAVKVDVPDLVIAPSYWQGATDQYDIRITVKNTGAPAITTTTTVALPAGLNPVGTAAPGCTSSGMTFTCPLAKGATTTIAITVTVAPNAWRQPHSGLVHTAAKAADGNGTAGAEDSFAVVFPPGPPTPGVDLATSDPILPVRSSGDQDSALLEVRLRNTGAVQALGTIEVITPVGVQVATVPAQCSNRERLSGSQERCTIGRVAAGQQVVLSFGLAVRPQARAEAPLRGSVLGSLLPSGQDAVTVQTSYQILVPNGPAQTRNPTGGPAVGAAVPEAGGDPGEVRSNPRITRSVSRPMSVIPVLTALVGLFTVLGVLVILSLRRRMRDESAPTGVGA